MMKRFLNILLVSVCVCIPAQAEVIISQVFYDTPLNEEINRPPYSNGEFIELYNTGTSTDTIAGWYLHGGGKTEIYEFPTGMTLPANSYLIVAYRHNATPGFTLDSLLDISYADTVLYQRKIVLSNSGENIALYNAAGERMDTLHYTARQAANDSPIEIGQCQSVQRITYSCDPDGQIVCNQRDWKADIIRLGQLVPQQMWLPAPDYYSTQSALYADNAYVVSVTPRSSVNSVNISEGQVTLSGGGLAQVAVEWTNPLGKSAMLMSRKQTPSGRHLVTMTDYTPDYGTRHWLPVYTTSDDMLSSETFIGLSAAQYDDDSAYTKTRTEPTFHGRPLTTTQPGEDYQPHPAQDSYGVNVGGQVKRWHVGTNGATRDGFYQGGLLQKLTHADEDGKTTTRYLNPQGQIVLLQVANNHETNYIYDDLGRLRYVLPPSCSNSVTTDFTDNTEKIKQYAYIYRYDNRGNCIYKKLPGCEPLYMVFDQAGRQVLSQDGNQRGRGNFWTLARYTELGQLAYTAEVELSEDDHDELIEYWSSESATVTFTSSHGTTAIGYETDAQISKLLVVNYYDTYDFLALLSNDDRTNLAYHSNQDYGEQYANTIGLLTGKRVYSLASDTSTITAYYYDADGNIIQQRSKQWNGGYDILFEAYNFDGSISKKYENFGNIVEEYWYGYDLAGRLVDTRYRLNENSNIVSISKNSYTELGRLDTVVRHNGADSVRYNYDLRGHTTRISSGDFTEQITYANGNTNHNGTISATTVSQGGVNLQWAYQYDNQNRLSSAQVPNGNSISYSESFTYDPMGNIQTLTRSNSTEIIDELTYTYNGNQLTAISDNAGEQSLYDQKEYFDYSNAENTMNYDANGNLLADFDRKICTIQYNLLNLPAIIQFCNGNSIVNTYNAEGVKLSSTYYTLPEVVTFPLGEVLEPETQPQSQQIMTVRYFGHMDETTTTDTLYYTLHTPEGYIALDDQEQITSWNYFRRDHLGNNVAVWNATADSTTQRMFYYPSGLPIGISTGQGTQPYKYNGKEYVEMHGLDEYDSFARRYYPTIMRTTTMDPMAEDYYHISPYAWCGNNSISNVDFNGQYYYDWINSCYRSSYGNHDEVEWSTIVAHNFIEPEPNSELSPKHLLIEFISGSSPKERNFGEEDPFTQRFIQSDRLNDLKDEIAIQIFVDGDTDSSNKKMGFKIGDKNQLEQLLIFGQDFLTLINRGGDNQNLPASMMGSFDLKWKLIGKDEKGNAIVKITVTNDMSAKSLLKIPILGYTDKWRTRIAPKIDNTFANGVTRFGLMATISINIEWTTTITNPNQ